MESKQGPIFTIPRSRQSRNQSTTVNGMPAVIKMKQERRPRNPNAARKPTRFDEYKAQGGQLNRRQFYAANPPATAEARAKQATAKFYRAQKSVQEKLYKYYSTAADVGLSGAAIPQPVPTLYPFRKKSSKPFPVAASGAAANRNFQRGDDGY